MQGSICEVVSFVLGGRGGEANKRLCPTCSVSSWGWTSHIYIYISCVYLYTNRINMIIFIYMFTFCIISTTLHSLRHIYKYYVYNSICWSLSSFFFGTYKVGPMTPLVLSVRMDCIEGHRLSDGKCCQSSRCEPGRNERWISCWCCCHHGVDFCFGRMWVGYG